MRRAGTSSSVWLCTLSFIQSMWDCHQIAPSGNSEKGWHIIQCLALHSFLHPIDVGLPPNPPPLGPSILTGTLPLHSFLHRIDVGLPQNLPPLGPSVFTSTSPRDYAPLRNSENAGISSGVWLCTISFIQSMWDRHQIHPPPLPSGPASFLAHCPVSGSDIICNSPDLQRVC